MRRILIIVAIAVTLLGNVPNIAVGQRPAPASSVCYPPAGDNRQRKPPAEAGFDTALLEHAVAFAKTQETKVPRDFSTQVEILGAPVRYYIREGGYDSAHNSKIIWRHHANQTSEWESSMFGKSHDFIGVEQFGAGRRQPRELKQPGEF